MSVQDIVHLLQRSFGVQARAIFFHHEEFLWKNGSAATRICVTERAGKYSAQQCSLNNLALWTLGFRIHCMQERLRPNLAGRRLDLFAFSMTNATSKTIFLLGWWRAESESSFFFEDHKTEFCRWKYRTVPHHALVVDSKADSFIKSHLSPQLMWYANYSVPSEQNGCLKIENCDFIPCFTRCDSYPYHLQGLTTKKKKLLEYFLFLQEWWNRLWSGHMQTASAWAVHCPLNVKHNHSEQLKVPRQSGAHPGSLRRIAQLHELFWACSHNA